MKNDPTELALVRQWAPQAKPGDRLKSAWCDDMTDEELLNWARRFLLAPR